MIPAGRNLKLNFRAPRAGEIRVGVVGKEGMSVEDCDPLHGDSMGTIVTWRGYPNANIAEGEAVVLHFSLRCAEVFSVEWV